MADKLTPQEKYDNLDPMGDLAKAFNNIDVFPSLEIENRKLKQICKDIQTKLNQTERELETFKKNINLNCEEMLKILRDGQEYGHTVDYTEEKRLELKKHYNWKDSL
jgi:hypothetical protein|tara:strand:+ start:200 stop:520 length:321 start_codon:yes stop_codon:yes gene_type:complete